jgi:hypothetical protein
MCVGSRAGTSNRTRRDREIMYIDPAAGSLVLQVLIAGVLAVTTMFKTARQSIARVFRSWLGSRKDR